MVRLERQAVGKVDNTNEIDEVQAAQERRKDLTQRAAITYKAICGIDKVQFLKTVSSMVASGATHADLANAFGCSSRSVDYWLVRYIEFKEAYEDGEKEAVQKMRQNIFKMGDGYEEEAVSIVLGKETEFDAQTGRRIREESKVIEHRYKRKVAKNGWAANRFLEMHDKEWKPQMLVQPTNQINIQNNYDLTIYSDDELRALEKMGLKKMIEQAQPDEI